MKYIAVPENKYKALCAAADAAKLIYQEMGTRVSPAAFSEFSNAAKDGLKKSVEALNAIRTAA